MKIYYFQLFIISYFLHAIRFKEKQSIKSKQSLSTEVMVLRTS